MISDKAFERIMNQIDAKKEKMKNASLNDHILICDGSNTFLRAFHASPQANYNGEHIGGISGFLQSLASVVRRIGPTRCIVTFDGVGGSKRRRQIYSDYKEGRKRSKTSNRFYEYENEDDVVEEDQKREIIKTYRYLQTLPVTIAMIDHVEADDVIAYAKSAVFSDSDITIMSTDKDFLQLVDKRTTVFRPTEKRLYQTDDVFEKYGIPPHQFMLYRIIEGDSSDNIDGVSYVGEKRIKKHLGELIMKDEMQTVNEIVQYCEQKVNESTTYERILRNEDILRRNWKLMQLHDVNISMTIAREIESVLTTPPTPLDRKAFKEMYQEDGLYDPIPYLNEWLSKSFSTLNKLAKNNNND